MLYTIHHCPALRARFGVGQPCKPAPGVAPVGQPLPRQCPYLRAYRVELCKPVSIPRQRWGRRYDWRTAPGVIASMLGTLANQRQRWGRRRALRGDDWRRILRERRRGVWLLNPTKLLCFQYSQTSTFVDIIIKYQNVHICEQCVNNPRSPQQHYTNVLLYTHVIM